MINELRVSDASSAGGLQQSMHTQAEAHGDFTSVLAGLAHETIGKMKAGEAAAIEGLQGNLPVQDVVNKVMAAEQALHTGIALRDKIAAAYLEISRMTI